MVPVMWGPVWVWCPLAVRGKHLLL